MEVRRRALYVVAAGLAALLVAGVALASVVGGDGDGDDSAVAPPTSTQPPGVAPGEPTPPPRLDTPGRPEPTWTPRPGGTAAPGTMRVLAPIDRAEIAVLESFPPRYRLQVQAGLPSGCARADGYEMTRAGNDIRVAVYNTLPTGNPVCTAIYGTYELSIDLGTNFVSGQEYRVNVNGTILSLRAQ
jgi:hypothetical protein